MTKTADPVGDGLVDQSWRDQEANVTRANQFSRELIAKRLEMLKDACS